MTNHAAAVEIHRLVHRYGHTDAVDGLDLRVAAGRCYGLFGRNGAGKTTTIKCLLNLIRPTSGEIRVFGLDPIRDEVAVKSRVAYVPDLVAFYPWMTVEDTLAYFASFRRHWNTETERSLLDQFRLNPRQKTSHLSKGQRTQLALTCAICPEPELLVLDEPTSGLDPIVRREFIQTVIGAYQDGDPGRRTVLVSTHLISEFEGLIDEFTIIDRGRNVLTLGVDAARERYQKVRARFASDPGPGGCARRTHPASARARSRADGRRQRGGSDAAARRALARGDRDRSADTGRDFRVHASTTGSGRLTRPTVWSPALAKEIRGLLPLWGGSVAALAAAFLLGKDALVDAGLLAYVTGSVAIGAQSIGQEYSHRTLPMLLAQPADRRRTYLRKFVVSAVMMLTLAVLARPVFATWGHPESWQFTLVVFTVLSGLFLAPLLTMVCRSSLAGMILGASVPASLWFVMLASVSLWFGIDAGEAGKRIRDPWMFGMLLVCPAAGFLGWRRFAALEATEAAAPALHLPRWLRRARGARYSPLSALVAKELHLQQLAIVVVVLNVIGWASLGLAQPYVRGLATFPVGAVLLLYCMGLAIMIGALASAEERHHGTLEWQLLQPTPAWQQWMVKVGVSLGLALVLSVGLPVLLIQLTPHDSFRAIRMSGHLTVLVVLLTASSMYISSLCSNGVRAMVLSLPIGLAVAYFMQTVSVALGWVTRVLAGPWMADIVTGAVAPPSVDPADIMIFAARAFSLTLAPLLLWFGFVNHTSSERTVRRVCQQVASIALVIVAGMILVGGVLAFHELRSR